MKVLYITNYGSMYGANKSLFAMMNCLKRNYNIEPYLLVSGRSGDIGKNCEAVNIPYFEHDFRISAIGENTKYKQARKLTRRSMRYLDFYKVYSYIQEKKLHFDLVHSNSSVFDIGLFLAKKWKIPHVWHVREYPKEGCGLEMVYGERKARNMYLHSASVIAISDSMVYWLQSLSYKIAVSKVYNGVDLPVEYRKNFYNNGIINFCIIGSIAYKKNQLDVIKACELILKKGRKNFNLYIVGDTAGEYYEEIQEYLKSRTALRNQVIFTGYCTDINDFLIDKDVGIVASDKEAFGRVTVEYMANYMPVIGTNTGGTIELLKDVGILYAPHDIEKLSEAMLYFIDNPEYLNTNRQAIRKRAEYFSVEKNAEMIYEVYRKVKVPN